MQSAGSDFNEDNALNWIITDVDPASLTSIRREIGVLRSQERIRILHAKTSDHAWSSRAGIVLQIEPRPNDRVAAVARILFMRSAVWESSRPDAVSKNSPIQPPQNASWTDVLRQLQHVCDRAAVESVIASPRINYESSATDCSRDSLEKAGFKHIARIHQLWNSCGGGISANDSEGLCDSFRVDQSRALSEDDQVLMKLIAETSDDPTTRFTTSPNDEREMNGAIFCRILHNRDVQALMVLQQNANQTGEIVYLGVAPEYRRRRFATFLVGEAMRFAREADCKGVTVATTENNSGAMRLYLKAGFQSVERFELMELRLDN